MRKQCSGAPDPVFSALRLGASGTGGGLLLLFPAAVGIRNGLLSADREALWILLAAVLGSAVSGLLLRKKVNRGWITCLLAGLFCAFLLLLMQAFLPGNALSVTGAAVPASLMTACWIVVLSAGTRGKQEKIQFDWAKSRNNKNNKL